MHKASTNLLLGDEQHPTTTLLCFIHYFILTAKQDIRVGDVCVINKSLAVVVRVHRKFTVRYIGYSPKYPHSFEKSRFVAFHFEDQFKPGVHLREGALEAAKNILQIRGQDWGSESGRKPCEQEKLIRSDSANRDIEIYKELRKYLRVLRRVNRGGRRGGHRGGGHNFMPGREDGVHAEVEGNQNDNLHHEGNIVIPDVQEDVQNQGSEDVFGGESDMPQNEKANLDGEKNGDLPVEAVAHHGAEVDILAMGEGNRGGEDNDYLPNGIHDGEGIIPVEILGSGENGYIPIEAGHFCEETDIILTAVKSDSHGNQAVLPAVADNVVAEKNICHQTGADELDDKGNKTMSTEGDFALHGSGSVSLTNSINCQKSQKRVAPTEEDTDNFDDSIEEERTIDPPSPKRDNKLCIIS
ncbi:hypothetical protein GCK72_023569 [Caenorhabditis remanei]|uniref:Uncharacterized protein n=1 Tax=Caenorhabditis remanei TaxID=31234 RepID=A0A6A5FWQ0_CAERE|nr:hypothetical protein GCK72_023569 [Caenorhabditis remanei]KAF1747110.1 hypothetical protein GCK72_023569 [Caenorhabditis remanei]